MPIRLPRIVLLRAVLALTAVGGALSGVSSPLFAVEAGMKLESPDFAHGEAIPPQFTCEGKNESPALRWSGVPKKTQSLVLMMEDPDAPMGNWVHWIVYNLPPIINDLPRSLPAAKNLINGESQGTNSFHKIGYGGPCPPSGTHHYYFRLYALDRPLEAKPGASKKDIEKEMQGHILAQAELLGLYTQQS